MQPGAPANDPSDRSSDGGFLGKDESLQTVVQNDYQTLQELEITHEALAEAISKNSTKYITYNSTLYNFVERFL